MSEPHLLFSYGTLRQSNVQHSLYGREVPTTEDELVGVRLEWLQITDPAVIATSGSDRHPVLLRGAETDRVAGACLELTSVELQITDDYEVDDYARHEAILASGRTAWVYLGADVTTEPALEQDRRG